MEYSIQATPLPLIEHEKLGTVRLLSSFPLSQQPSIEHMVGIHDMRCVTLDGALYIPWNDIEPFTCGLDGWDLDEVHWTMQTNAATLTNDTVVADAARLAEARRVNIEERGAALGKAVFQNTGIYATNPFFHEPFGACFWRSVAIVGAYNADTNAAKGIAQAYNDFVVSVTNSTVNLTGLPNIFRVLLSVVDVKLGEHFADVWYGPDCGYRLSNRADASPQLVPALRLLALTFTGWRGDPDGSICSGLLMDRCLDDLVRRASYYEHSDRE
jgi:hypothetical protein